MRLVSAEDFVGDFQVGRSDQIDLELNSFIDNHQDAIMANLLGVDLYNELLTDIGTSDPIVVTDPLLKFIYDKFMAQDGCGCGGRAPLVSLGIPFFLKGIIYYKWMQKTQVRPIMSGGVGKKSTSNNETQWQVPSQVYTIYNESILTGRAIQNYATNNRNDYPSFRGRELLLNSAF